jgi:hypothetical protein
VIDPDAAPIVRNIFEMQASGISPHHIADKLNEGCVPIPSDYYYAKLGSQILAEQGICGVLKLSGRYFRITPTSDILFSSAPERSAIRIIRSSKMTRKI